MTRDGNDMRMDLPVTLKEAVLGGKVPVPTLTGTVSLTVPPNSNTGTVLRLKGKGIAGPWQRTGGRPLCDWSSPCPTSPIELSSFAEGWAAEYDPRAKMR